MMFAQLTFCTINFLHWNKNSQKLWK